MRALFLTLVLAAAAAGCAEDAPEPPTPARAAAPQSAELKWEERFTEGSASMTFRVRSFEVLASGWEAEISITNGTPTRYSVGDPQATVDRVFGVMLFRSGDLQELEDRNASRELPSIRRADRFRPQLPLVLEPGATWAGTISARGSLAADRWVRVVFGALVPIGEPPERFPPALVWITDHAYRLR